MVRVDYRWWTTEVGDCIGDAYAFPVSHDADLVLEEIDVEFDEDVAGDLLFCKFE